MLSDQSLIETFVQDSLQGRESLLANPNLQAMMNAGVQQLMAKQSGIVMSASLEDGHPQFLVQLTSTYNQLIGQVLVSQGFLPSEDMLDRNTGTKQHSFLKYIPVKLPKGYEPRCTGAIDLWKTWWSYAKRSRSQVIPLDLVIRCRHTWYPIKDIFVTEGLIYIKTLGAEIALHSGDTVFWLKKDKPVSLPAKPSVLGRRVLNSGVSSRIAANG
ncbi:MAG: hypothetical protein AAF921_12245 [Cyanobacteria bacterium P01_D01_bin.44]